MFTPEVSEKLGHYVYFLRDPREEKDKEVFYIGKGKGNRIFDHIACKNVEDSESDKIARINEIQNAGMSVERFVLRHGLTENSALEIEAAVIDFVGIRNLTNIQSGHYSTAFGVKTTEEVIAMYSAEPLKTDKPVLLININKQFDSNMNAKEVYDATRKWWVVGKRREKAKYAITTYRGLTREVYAINKWKQDDDRCNRWGFEGELAEEDTRNSLLHKSIAGLSKRGAANPIRYLNC